ncbi:MAG: DegT/DnrJ/EryC1/StrS family aminotransferase [candidate division NC10 bacterium]|nr:DegT/DnrJ/EryC1/StrS family aminotransferase [candidate division NC10 bacterium]
MGDRGRRLEFLIFGSPAIGEEEIAEVVATLRSGWLGTGPRVQRFEEDFRVYVGCGHAVALNSCTAGLHLALEVLGIGPGDEVITSPLTFSATANVIVHVGATPVFADVDPRTMNLDPEALARAVTPRTKAILPVHLAGRPCDMDALLQVARRHGVAVVEDAAHAVEARYRGRSVGSIGDLTAFSFYVTKNLVTGEGGMLTTDNAAWAEEIRIKALHGISRDAWKRYSAEGFQPYDTLFPGYKYNMTDLQAALGIHQLARLESNLAIRERHWRQYDAALADHPLLTTPSPVDPRDRHARHLYTVLVDTERAGMSRNEFMVRLKAENIGTGIHFTPLHLHSYYAKTLGFRRGQFPAAEFIGDRTVSLPLSAKLTDEDVEDVITAVRRVLEA